MYLSADGGGSKLHLLLVDGNLNMMNFVECAGVNTNFIPEDIVKRTISEAVERCVPDGCELHCVSLSVLCLRDYSVESLKKRAKVQAFHVLKEGDAGLLAGTGSPQGFAALSGTGSDVFFSGNGLYEAIGGWGMLLGDEGSGCEIGQKGLKSAIHSYDGRAQPGLLLDLLMDRWSIQQNTFAQLCSRIYNSPASRSEIAAFAPLVGEAARKGDKAAIAIYRQAGLDLALQMNTLIARVGKRIPDVARYPITLCGGAWKGSYHMFRAFRNEVLEKNPGMHIVWPMFDAVVSGVIYCAQQGGMKTDEIVERLKQTCTGLIYQKPEDWSD